VLHILWESYEFSINKLIFDYVKLSDFNELAKNILGEIWYLDHGDHREMHEE
jgi:hypothetical protein